LLEKEGVEFQYRDYVKAPLSEAEITKVLKGLGVEAREILRKNDKVSKQLGLTGSEGEEVLIGLMARHPTLIQRPIGIVGAKVVLGRPPERLIELVG
jgi:arsenate reductase